MTIPADAMAAAAPQSPPPAAAPAVLPARRPFYWSLRREMWENRSLTIAPLIAAGVVLFGFTVSAVHLAHNRQEALAMAPSSQAMSIGLPYDFAAMAIIVTGLIVGGFYCLGALHNERRDRSILFWKSLPVSDLTTVLAKATIPLIVLPLILFAVIVVTQLIMLALSTVILLAGGMDPSTTWTRMPFLQLWLVVAYGVAVVTLWYAPIWAWLLMVSGWARRATFLWAVLPPLAICVIEKIAFNTDRFASLISYRFNGFVDGFTIRTHGKVPLGPLPQIDAAGLLAAPGLWAGLAFAAAFIAVAVWQRRRREPV
jgi:ABC-2 type transport system permease protein